MGVLLTDPNKQLLRTRDFPGQNVWWILSRVRTSRERVCPGVPGKTAPIPKQLHLDWGAATQVFRHEGPGHAGVTVLGAVQTAAAAPRRTASKHNDRSRPSSGHSPSVDPALAGTQEVPGDRSAPILPHLLQPQACPPMWLSCSEYPVRNNGHSCRARSVQSLSESLYEVCSSTEILLPDPQASPPKT